MDSEWEFAIKMLELQEELGRGVTTSEIFKTIKEYKGFDLDPMYVERKLMVLFDLGIVSADWEKIDGLWYRTYYICDDCIELVRKARDKHE